MKKTKSQILYEKAKGNHPSYAKRRTHLMFPEDIETDGNQNIIRFNINLPSGSRYLEDGTYTASVDPETGETKTSVFRTTENKSNLSRRFGENYTRTKTKIDLFMPDQVQSAYGADWQQTDLGVVGSIIDNGFNLAGVNNWEDAAKQWESLKNTSKENFLRSLTSAVQAITPIEADSARQVATSTVANPYTEVIFNGINNRTFSYTFKMVPRNEREQQTIQEIIREFKFHQAPELKYGEETGQINYMLFPSEFDITFLHKGVENSWMFKISTCALTNFTVNYTPDGRYASHGDGSPFSVELTMDFTEMETLTKERIYAEGF